MQLRHGTLPPTPLVILAAGCARMAPPPPPTDEGETPTDLRGQIAQLVEEARGPSFDDLLPRDVEVVSVTSSPELGRVVVDFSTALLHQPVRLDTDERVAERLRPIVERHLPGAEIIITADDQPLDQFIPRPFGGDGPVRDPSFEVPADEEHVLKVGKRRFLRVRPT